MDQHIEPSVNIIPAEMARQLVFQDASRFVGNCDI
jgi:hypothetical protein